MCGKARSPPLPQHHVLSLRLSFYLLSTVQYNDALAKARQHADTAKQYQDMGLIMKQKLAQARHKLEQVGSQVIQTLQVPMSICLHERTSEASSVSCNVCSCWW